MKKLFIDIDSTIYNSQKRLVEYLNAIYNKNVNYKDIKKYNCTCSFPKTSASEVEEIFDDKEFYSHIKLFKKTKETIRALQERYDIIFLTKGSRKNIYHKCSRLNYDFHSAKVVTISKNISKGLIDMDDSVIIDDLGKNLLESNASIKILFAPFGINDYNSDAFNHPDIEVVKNWKDVRRFLL